MVQAAFIPKLISCGRSATASEHCKQGDRPSAQLSRLGFGPHRGQQHTSNQASTNTDLNVEWSVFRKPKHIEKGNPLQDEEKLLQGLPIVEPEDEVINTIRKVPSDQTLMPLRWGSNRRATGRSRSGLQVCIHECFSIRKSTRVFN